MQTGAVPFPCLTTGQLLTRIESVLKVGAGDPLGSRSDPGFTLVLGSGFSYGVVPTTAEMMRAELGPALAELRDGVLSIKENEEQTREFWRRFRDENPGLVASLVFDKDGFPQDAAAAYQLLFRPEASGGLEDPFKAQSFLRYALRNAQDRLNGAHFFLGAILDEQRRIQNRSRRPFCRTIFTTNFDPLLQASLQLFHLLYYMTDRPDRSIDRAGLREDEAAIHLIYSHGSIFRPFQASSEEEIESLLGNSATFADYFSQRHVIVIGYAGWRDSIMEGLRTRMARGKFVYWCDIKPPERAHAEFNSSVQSLYEAGRSKSFFYVALGPGGADAFMGELYRRLFPDPGYPRLLKDPFPLLIERLKNTHLGRVSISQPMAETSTTGGDQFSPAQQVPRLLPTAEEHLRLVVYRLERAQREWLVADRGDTPPPLLESEQEEPGGQPFGGPEVQSLLLKAQAAFDAERWDEAVRLFGQVAEHSDVSPQLRGAALVSRGYSRERGGEPKSAIDDYEKIIDEPATNAGALAFALIQRSDARFDAGDDGGVIEDLTRAIGLSGIETGQLATAFYRRGRSHHRAGNVTEALRDFERAGERPESGVQDAAAALLQMSIISGERNDREAQMEAYDRVIDMSGVPPSLLALALAARAKAFDEQGDANRQVQDLTRVIELDGADDEQVSQALVSRGVTHWGAGREDEAMADIDRAVQLHAGPERLGKALLVRGLYRETRDLEGAIEDYTQIIDLPEVPLDVIERALIQRAKLQDQRGSLEQALTDFDRLLNWPGVAPEKLAECRICRGGLRLNRKEAAEAITDFTAVIDGPVVSVNRRAQAFFLLGIAHVQIGENDRAVRAFGEALGLEGVSPKLRAQALLNRGLTHFERKEVDPAVADFTGVIELDGVVPQNLFDAYLARGWARYRDGLGDAKGFREDSEAAYAIDATNVLVRFNLALALLFEGRDAEAFAAYRDAAELARAEPLALTPAINDLQAAENVWLSQERAAPIAALLTQGAT